MLQQLEGEKEDKTKQANNKYARKYMSLANRHE